MAIGFIKLLHIKPLQNLHLEGDAGEQLVGGMVGKTEIGVGFKFLAEVCRDFRSPKGYCISWSRKFAHVIRKKRFQDFRHISLDLISPTDFPSTFTNP